MLVVKKNFKLCIHIVLKNVGDKSWALSTISGNQYKLNELSYFILNEIVQPNNVDQIVEAITATYNVSAKEATRDCKSLLKDAINNGLAEEVTI